MSEYLLNYSLLITINVSCLWLGTSSDVTKKQFVLRIVNPCLTEIVSF